MAPRISRPIARGPPASTTSLDTRATADWSPRSTVAPPRRSRAALMQLNVVSSYTYTVDTLIQAAGKRLRVTEIVAPARRRAIGTSRMTHSLVRYIGRTGNQALRTTLHANPLRAFGRLSAAFA